MGTIGIRVGKREFDLVHVGDGQLSGAVLASGAIVAGLGITRSLASLSDQTIPRVAVMSSVFFAASLWHVPLPGGSVHLVLCGLLGLLLGRQALLAAAIVLTLQAVLFGHGGITSLGVNILAMGLPGPLLAKILSPLWRRAGGGTDFLGGFLLGSGSVLVACLFLSACYAASDSEYLSYLPVFFAAHVPLMVVEGILTGSTLAFLKRVRPELVGAPAGIEGEGVLDAA